MSHAHEIDSSRPLPGKVWRRVVLWSLFCLAVTAFGVVHILMPTVGEKIQQQTNNKVAEVLGYVHQQTTQAKPVDWRAQVKEVQKAAQKAIKPVEQPQNLPDELFEYAADMEEEQH